MITNPQPAENSELKSLFFFVFGIKKKRVNIFLLTLLEQKLFFL